MEGSGKADGELTNPCAHGTHHGVLVSSMHARDVRSTHHGVTIVTPSQLPVVISIHKQTLASRGTTSGETLEEDMLQLSQDSCIVGVHGQRTLL